MLCNHRANCVIINICLSNAPGYQRLSHWHALFLDKSIPFSPDAKAAFLYDSSRKTKQFLYPFVRVFARLGIILLQVFKAIMPNVINAPKMLHRSLYIGMKYFITPEANYLILRHFVLGSEVLRFIKDNVKGIDDIPMHPLVALNNKHPMVPLPTTSAAFRLTLHGLSTEVLHALLVQKKLEAGRA